MWKTARVCTAVHMHLVGRQHAQQLALTGDTVAKPFCAAAPTTVDALAITDMDDSLGHCPATMRSRLHGNNI